MARGAMHSFLFFVFSVFFVATLNQKNLPVFDRAVGM